MFSAGTPIGTTLDPGRRTAIVANTASSVGPYRLTIFASGIAVNALSMVAGLSASPQATSRVTEDRSAASPSRSSRKAASIDGTNCTTDGRVSSNNRRK